MILWAILGTIAGLCVLFMLVQRFRLPPNSDSRVIHLASRLARDIEAAPVPSSVKEMLSSCRAPNSSSLAASALPVSQQDDDPRLRLFDEL